MRLFKLFLFGIFLVVFWSCSDLGDPLQVPEIEVSTSLNFDSVSLEDSTEATLQISNDGTLALILDSLRITGTDSADFQFTSQLADSKEIAPKGNLNITIRFKPSALGAKTAALNIFSNDPDNPSLTVSFTVGNVLVSYATQIQPIFTTNCTSCHGVPNGLYLTSYDNLMIGNSNNGPVITAGDADNSVLVQKILGTAGFGGRMPADNPSYFDSHQDELQLIKDWIDEGAQDN